MRHLVPVGHLWLSTGVVGVSNPGFSRYEAILTSGPRVGVSKTKLEDVSFSLLLTTLTEVAQRHRKLMNDLTVLTISLAKHQSAYPCGQPPVGWFLGGVGLVYRRDVTRCLCCFKTPGG